MKKITLLYLLFITIIGSNVKAQNITQNCENIDVNAMYNCDYLSFTATFMEGVKKRVNCVNTNPKTLCSKTVFDIGYFTVSTHNKAATGGTNPLPAYNAYVPLTNAYNAAILLGINNTSTSVNTFAQTLRAAVQRDVDNEYGIGVKKIKSVLITSTVACVCTGSIGHDIYLTVKFCVDKNENTHD